MIVTSLEKKYKKNDIPVLLEMRMLKVAEAMFKRGARVPVVNALMPINRERLIKLHVEVTGKNPKTGPLPSDHSWYSSTTYPMRMIQSSILLDIYTRIKPVSKEALEAEVLVSTYDLYLDHCKAIKAEPLITFVRLWHLIQQIRINTLMTATCIHCKGHYVVTVGKLHSRYACLLCMRTPSLKPESYQKNERAMELAA